MIKKNNQLSRSGRMGPMRSAWGKGIVRRRLRTAVCVWTRRLDKRSSYCTLKFTANEFVILNAAECLLLLTSLHLVFVRKDSRDTITL